MSDGTKVVNYVYVLNLNSDGGFPGAALLQAANPCVYWFGNDYPQNSPIYERNAGLKGIAGLDSTYVPPPDGGWPGFLTQALTSGKTPDAPSLSKFTQLQTYPWYLFSAATPSLANILGSRPKQPQLGLLSLPTLFSPTLPAFTEYTSIQTPSPNPTDSSAQLNNGDITFNGIQPVPYFIQSTPTQSLLATTQDMDNDLSTRLTTILQTLAQLNKSVLFMNNPQPSDYTAFYAAAGSATSNMPYAAILLDDFNADTMSTKITVHVGSDKRISAAASYPSTGKRAMLVWTQIVQGLLRSFEGVKGGMRTSGTITQGVRAFPEKRRMEIDINFGGLIGRVLYPFGISFLLPIFAITLVKEKEDRILIMMKMNGMKTGTVMRLDMFSKTDKSLLLVLFIIWGKVQIIMALFFSSIFKKSRLALVLNDCFWIPSTPPPCSSGPLCILRALSLLNRNSYNKNLEPYTMNRVKEGDEVYTAITMLILDFFLYLGVSLYLNAVLPSEFGIRRPWHFPVTDVVEMVKKRQRKLKNGGTDPQSESNLFHTVNDTELQFEDADVKAERLRVQSHQHDPTSPLIISGMRKVYAGRKGLGPKIAVKDVTFAAEEGLILGLLGPNGAGKTTLISILTGVYEASSGSAKLAGFDVKTESGEVYKSIGFDILWDELTVGEHLYFYARLKGVPKWREREAVAKSLADVSLTTLEDRKTKGLSGGEKRRLSIAIALVGDPVVVFLDEPTTGLDPEVRRLIWSIVQASKKGKTIVLTTHSMEEAEALCQRIGIMAKGTVRCLANPLRLKELYGSGFRIFFNSKEEDTERACTWIESILPEGWKKMDAFATNTSYEFPPSTGIISSLFVEIEAGKARNGILDWGISQTTLEEVFLRIITDDDANAD
ncbi:hypothetical protein BC829DRAFT_417287 [Chytridium lagenaria]|nr:hypothetical protein BC829DRAFT_417287 [Chytridium lagenaria]